jgi:hypothetical protein
MGELFTKLENPAITDLQISIDKTGADVEIYPSKYTSSIFQAGDIMISLRNINSVLVFDPSTYRIKYRITGDILRQHDPDFTGGDTISVFDNNNLKPIDGDVLASQIVEFDARTNKRQLVIDGAGSVTFFTNIMGSHSTLDNGNILLSSTREGRVLEFTRDGVLAWEYINVASSSKAGLVTSAIELPSHMNKEYFSEFKTKCN